MAHLDTERISAYIDKELPPADMATVEEHLTACEACRAEYHDLRAITTMVRDLPIYSPRRAVVIDDDERDRDAGIMPILLDFAKPVAVAAIIILVALAGLRLVTDSDDPEGPDTDEITNVLQDESDGGTESEFDASLGVTAPADPAPAMSALSDTPDSEAEESTLREAEAPGDADEEALDAEPDEGDGFGLAEVLVTGIALVVAAAAGWRVFTRGRSNRSRA